MVNVRDGVDAALEFAVVPSFTTVGLRVRRRIDAWSDAVPQDLAGRVMVITGATSGLGLAAARQLAAGGATVVVVGRNAERNEATVAELSAATSNDAISQVAADMGDYDQVRALADAVAEQHGRVDVLVHNAGALSSQRLLAPDGTEATVASQVVGPFLLTALLLDRLRSSAPSRVLTMSSGGMYTEGLRVSGLQMSADSYKGAEQYARAKRAQVSLNEEWARRFGHLGIAFHSMHPGWADTPGVDDALPVFAKVMGPLLRTPDEGADTLVWLATAEEPLQSNGRFWLDRRVRSTHRLRSTRRSDTPARRSELWDWVAQTAGISPSDA